MDSCFWLAETVAIWSFGGHRGNRDLGISLSSLYRPRFLTGIAVLALVLGMAAPALAVRHHHRNVASAPRRAVVRMPASPTDPGKDAALIVDGATGKVLYARNETA